MTNTIETKTMINYLQSLLNKFMQEENKYGMQDRIVQKYFDEMIACKEMVEALIGLPVNLQKDGQVTIGF